MVPVVPGAPWADRVIQARGYHRVNPQAWENVVDLPPRRKGCLTSALALTLIGLGFVGTPAYLAYHIARAVWS
jgi:hypothetical protein